MLFRQVKFFAAALLAIAAVAVSLAAQVQQVSGQLPDDIQRELNQNLAEQARIQAMRQQHQRQMQARLSRGRATGQQQQQQQQQQPTATTGANHDPNNYSYQQVSPPIQYSYYQPYGDAATTAAPVASSRQQQPVTPINIDLNNLNFDLPEPQAQVASGAGSGNGAGMVNPAAAAATGGKQQQQQHLTPSFTGAGGLPILQPTANSANQADSYAPAGAPPLAPQAQQGPPLTEADFKDITGGENYGAPGGNDFGLGDAASLPSGGASNKRASQDNGADAQLREFGLPGGADFPGMGQPSSGGRRRQQAASSPQISIPDFGSFNPIGAGSKQRLDNDENDASSGGEDAAGNGFPGGNDNFGGNFENLAGGQGNTPAGGQSSGGNDGGFDFASQPSSNRAGDGADGAGDPTASAGMGGGAPGSLQSLLGSGFPGLGGGNGGGGSALDDFARSTNDPQAQLSGQSRGQRNDDGALDIADLGDKSDQFSGADLGGFEQPNPAGDQDFNYASASDQQPRTVPYRDSNPQAVGAIFAVTQPQSMTQTRYNALPDKGTYQDYPAYLAGENDFVAVAGVVDSTAKARPSGPGRYSLPSPRDLAPEYRQRSGQLYDYNRAPDLQ